MMKATIALVLFGAASAANCSHEFRTEAIQYNVSLHVGAGAVPETKQNSSLECQAACKAEAKCEKFSYWPANKNCWYYGANPGEMPSTPAGAMVVRGNATCAVVVVPTAAPTFAPTVTTTPAPAPDNSGMGDSGSGSSGSGSAIGSSNPDGSMGIKSSGDSLPGSSGSGHSGSGESSSNPWWLLLAIPVAGLAAVPLLMGKKAKRSSKKPKPSKKPSTPAATPAPEAQPLMDPMPVSTFALQPVHTATMAPITSVAPPVLSAPLTMAQPMQYLDTMSYPAAQPVSFQQPLQYVDAMAYPAQPVYQQPGFM